MGRVEHERHEVKERLPAVDALVLAIVHELNKSPLGQDFLNLK